MVTKTLFALLLGFNMVILSQMYIELQDLKSFMNDKSLILNTEVRKLPLYKLVR